MAAAMFTLLVTAFLPIAGIKFAWVTWHWAAGLVLSGSILFHVDSRHVVARLLVDLGGPARHSRTEGGSAAGARATTCAGPRPGKYPLGNRLYHLAIVLAGLSVVATGLFMMMRVRTPFFTRDPYIFSDTHLGPDLCAARHGGRGARRPRHRARLFRRAAREVVDHEVDDPRLDHATAVSGTPRPGQVDRPARAPGRSEVVALCLCASVARLGNPCAKNCSVAAKRSKKPTSSCSPTPPRGCRAMAARRPADSFASF